MTSSDSSLAFIAPSRTKREFFAGLKLLKGCENDERIYKMMLVGAGRSPGSVIRLTYLQDEAAAGRQRLGGNLEDLRIHYQGEGEVQQRYSYNHFTESALLREILHIWHKGAAELQPFYARGQHLKDSVEDNWVIRWCLYHSFRYTDKRNRNSFRTSRPSRDVSRKVASSLHHDPATSQRRYTPHVIK